MDSHTLCTLSFLLVFLVWLLSFTLFWDLSMLLHIWTVPSFSLLRSTPLYRYITMCLSSHLLVDIRIVSKFWLLQIELLFTSLWVDICFHMSWGNTDEWDCWGVMLVYIFTRNFLAVNVVFQVWSSLGEGWEAGGQSQGSLTPPPHLLKLSVQIWYSNRVSPCIMTPCPHMWVGIRIPWGVLNMVPAETYYWKYCLVRPGICVFF